MLRVFVCAWLISGALAANPANWVPVRWSSTDPKTLALLQGTKVNCLLLESADAASPEFNAAAARQNIAPVAVIRPASDAVAQAQAAVTAKIQGIVLEGDFPEAAASAVRAAAPGIPVIAITPRAKLDLTSANPVIGTDQGLWAGIQITEDGAAKAGPSGSAWIDTNAGFLRAVCAVWSGPSFWLANTPPAKQVIPITRYLQMIGDAAMGNARWVVALDPDLSARLYRGDPKARADWARITELLAYYEDHREWRVLRPAGKLALVQATREGGLLSGGILDMIAVKHTPVRAVPPAKLSAETLAGATLVVNVDSRALNVQQKGILQNFARAGGTVLTGPAGSTSDEARADKNKITLDEKEFQRLDDLWRNLQNKIGRHNLGVRLFNVSSMLSNFLASPDSKQVYVELVNFADYPVENVSLHVLGTFTKATLFTPDGKMKSLEIYKSEDGTGVDLDTVGVTATVRLEN